MSYNHNRRSNSQKIFLFLIIGGVCGGVVDAVVEGIVVDEEATDIDVVDIVVVEIDVVDKEMDVEVNEGVVSTSELSLTTKPMTNPITIARTTAAIPRPI